MASRLTPEQEAKMPAYRDRWAGIGLDCSRVNFEEAKHWALEAYKKAGLKPPKDVYSYASPLAAWSELSKILKVAREKLIPETAFGNQDAWLSYYNFTGDVLKEDVEKTVPLMRLAECCGWWILTDIAIGLIDRPLAIHRDDRGELHHDTKPCVEWTDGAALYAVHGVFVKPLVILTPKLITREMVDEESNVDVRRVLIEKYGQLRYLKEVGAEVVHMDNLLLDSSDPTSGDLHRALLRSKDEDQWLVTTDGSPNSVYTIPVDSDAKTCAEAHTGLMPLGLKDEDVHVQG